MTEINTTRWNRLRYTTYAPIYDGLVKSFMKGQRRALELLAAKPGERVLNTRVEMVAGIARSSVMKRQQRTVELITSL